MKLKLKPFEVHIMVVKEMCNACQGDGHRRDETIPCYYCKGMGFIRTNRPEAKKL